MSQKCGTTKNRSDLLPTCKSICDSKHMFASQRAFEGFTKTRHVCDIGLGPRASSEDARLDLLDLHRIDLSRLDFRPLQKMPVAHPRGEQQHARTWQQCIPSPYLARRSAARPSVSDMALFDPGVSYPFTCTCKRIPSGRT